MEGMEGDMEGRFPDQGVPVHHPPDLRGGHRAERPAQEAMPTGRPSCHLLIWLPFLFSANIIADSVAGERERHTLETLLASSLPDRAIVLGKMSVTFVYAWGMALLGAVLALVVANFRSTSLVMYPADVLVGLVLLSLLAAVFVSAMGVLISLKAQTSREAPADHRHLVADHPVRLAADRPEPAERGAFVHSAAVWMASW